MKQSRYLLWLSLFIFLVTGLLQPAFGEIKVKKIGEADLKNIFASHKNKVLLVNVWATWCKPCREEFPDLVRLQAFYKSKGKDVQIIAISADYPDEIETKILPFLKKFKINFPVYVQNFSKQENFIDLLNKDWNGALPATFIYDKRGRQRAFFIGKRDFEFFRKQMASATE